MSPHRRKCLRKGLPWLVLSAACWIITGIWMLSGGALKPWDWMDYILTVVFISAAFTGSHGTVAATEPEPWHR